MNKTVLFDIPGCIGCRACENACKTKYNLPKIEIGQTADLLPAEPTTNKGTYTRPAELSAYTWIKIRYTELEDKERGFRIVHTLRKCMHCLHPACVAACPVGALTKNDMGATVYDDKKCIGCRYCMLACPFGIPTFEWDKPVAYIRKCIYCPDLLAEGKDPACVQACAKRTKCITMGEREEQLEKARMMISNPKRTYKYIDHIYGEHEVGGTNWIYISEEPFENIGLRTYGSHPVPEVVTTTNGIKYTNFPQISWGGNYGQLSEFSKEPVPTNTERAMLAVPFALPGVAVAMAGLYWVFKRKDKLAQENAGKKGEVAK